MYTVKCVQRRTRQTIFSDLTYGVSINYVDLEVMKLVRCIYLGPKEPFHRLRL